MKFSSMWPLTVLLVVFISSCRGSPVINVPPPPPLIHVFANPSIPQLPIYEPVHVHLPVEHKGPHRPPVFVPGHTDVVSSGNLPPLFFGDVLGDPRDFPVPLAGTETQLHTNVGWVPSPIAAIDTPLQTQSGGILPASTAIEIPSLIQNGGISSSSSVFETTSPHTQAGGVPLGAVTNARPVPIIAPNHIGNEAPIPVTTYRPAIGDPAFNAAKSLLNTPNNSGFTPSNAGLIPNHRPAFDEPVFTTSKALINSPNSGFAPTNSEFAPSNSRLIPNHRPAFDDPIFSPSKSLQNLPSSGGTFIFPRR